MHQAWVAAVNINHLLIITHVIVWPELYVNDVL